MVFGGNHRQRIALVTVTLEIAGGDIAEHAGETVGRIALFGQIGGPQQRLADFRPRCSGHLFDADHQHDAGGFGIDGFNGLMHGGAAGGAGIFNTGRRFETQIVGGLQHEAGGEILRREARTEMAQHDLVDIRGLQTRMIQRFARDADNQAFDADRIQLSKRRMRPTHNCSRHCSSPRINF